MDDADDQRLGRVWVYIPGYSSRRFDVDSGASPTYGGTPPDRATGRREADRRSQEFRTGWIECYPLFPFFGSDDYRVQHGLQGRNATTGDSSSYGMCFQPRNGDLVGVFFAFGDPSRAFWLGCMPRIASNFMVPGMAGSKAELVNDKAGSGIKEKVDITKARVPTLEKRHRTDQTDEEGESTRQNPRYQNVYPAAEFANNLLEAGLICDVERGAGVSSFRRESPSYVMGLKSPGWAYDSEKKNINSATGEQFDKGGGTREYAGVETYGHQIVLDDHPEYQSVRVRSAAGSQILLNDSADRGNTPYIWINTPKGNVWIELRDDGGVNIFAGDSVSVHAEGDLNLTTDRDLNLQVGRNMTVNVDGDLDFRVSGQSEMQFTDELIVQNDASVDWKITGSMAIETFGGYDLTSAAHVRIGASGSFGLTALEDFRLTSERDIDVLSKQSMRYEAKQKMDIKAGGIMRQSSGAKFMVKAGGDYAEQASNIYMNSGAVQGAESAKIAEEPESPFEIGPRPTQMVFLSPTQEEIYQCTEPDVLLETIVPVVPQHLPWPPIVKDSSGFSGWVEVAPEGQPQARRGATSLAAVQPVPMSGWIQGQPEPGVYAPVAYATTSVAEAPQYVKVRDFEPGELNPARVYETSDRMKEFIRRREGYVPLPYRDAGKAWAVGYGHNIVVGDIINGLRVTSSDIKDLDRSEGKLIRGQAIFVDKSEAEELFEKDLNKFEDSVRRSVTTDITQGQFDAMVSFAYNLGTGAYEDSSMLRRVNERRFEEVPSEWMRWTHVGQVVKPGLVTRRKQELEFFTA